MSIISIISGDFCPRFIVSTDTMPVAHNRSF